MIKTVIGLDVGHSRVKVSVANTITPTQRHDFSFPTLVSNWQNFSDDTAAKHAKEDTVEVDGRKFFVGNTVMLQNSPDAFVGVHFDWFEKLSSQYGALTKAAFLKSRPYIDAGDGDILIVCGLPARASREDRNLVRELTRSVIAPVLTASEGVLVLCQNQANAPIFHMLFNEDGTFNPTFKASPQTISTERDGEIVERDIPATTYGVIEVGHLTTDYAILAGIVGVESATSSTSGVFGTFEDIQKELRNRKMNSDLSSVANALIDKELDGVNLTSVVDSACANLIQETVTTAKEVFGNRRLDGILLAGGGASIVYPAIKELFPRTQVLKKPRFAVAEGFVRRGLARFIELKGSA